MNTKPDTPQAQSSDDRYKFGQPFHSDFFAIKNSKVVQSTNGNGKESAVRSGFDQLNSSATPSNNVWLQHGANDQQPQVLKHYYKSVAINKRAIGFKSMAVRGSGLEFEPTQEYFQFDELSREFRIVENNQSEAEIKREISKAKAYAELMMLDAFHKAFSLFMALFGGVFAHVYFRKTTKGIHQPFKIKAVSPETGRLGEENDFFTDNHTHHYYSEHFGKVGGYNVKSKVLTYEEYQALTPAQRKRRKSIIEIPSMWSTKTIKKREKIRSLHISNLDEGYRNYYGTPDYECEQYFNNSETVRQKGIHDKADITNRLGLTTIITIFRKTEDSDAKEKQLRQRELELWRTKMKGAHNAGNFILDRVKPSVDKQGKPITEGSFKITTIPTNNTADRNKNLSDEANIGLLTAHGIIDPKIAGIPNLSSSGLSNEMDFFVAALEQIESGIIAEYSSLEMKQLTKLFHHAGIRVTVKRKRSLPLYKIMSDKLMEMVLLNDEIRETFGFSKLSEDQRKELSERVAKAAFSRTKNDNQ